jgi:signal transduction histidine kinase
MKKHIQYLISAIWQNKKLMISVGLSLIFSLLVRTRYLPYSVDNRQISIGRKGIVLYHDFDHDGNSEKIDIEFRFRMDDYFVHIFDSKGRKRYTIDVKRWKLFRYKHYFDDYNSDGLDELYLLNKESNKVILYGYDFNKNILFFKKTVFVFSYLPRDLKEHLPYLASFVGLQDVNRDGKKEVILFYNEINNFLDSRIVAIDIPSGKIVLSSQIFPYYFRKAILQNLDDDPQKEIILIPSRIYKNQKPYAKSALKNWMVILDDDFKVMYRKKFPKNWEKISILPFIWRHTSYLLVLGIERIRGKDKTYARVFDLSGKTIISRTFENGEIILPPEKLTIHISNYFCIPTQLDNRTIFNIYSPKLKLLHQLNIPGKGYKAIGVFHSNSGGLNAFVYANSEKVILIGPDGELKASTMIEAPFRYFHITWKLDRHKTILGINSLDYFYELNISKNYLYTFIWLFFFIFSGFFYGFLITLEAIYREYWASKLLKSTTINKAPRGILLLNQKGEVIFYNQNIETFFKMNLSQSKNPGYTEIFKNIPPIIEFIQDLFRHRKVMSQEIAFLNGQILFNGQILGIPLKKIIFLSRMYYLEIEDFSQPFQSDRLKVWSEAVNKMVHDIKTPLATIGINLQLLRYKLKDIDMPDKEENLKKFDTIEKELQRVREISREFLRFTNLSSPNMEEFDLIRFIHRILKKMLPLYAEKVNFEFFPDEKELYVRGDKRLLELLFDVLLENGIQAIDGKGRIRIYFKQNSKEPRVTIFVEDNGRGMTREEIEKIFEPFYTTKEDGSGMGLVFAQKITKDHGSELKVKSEKGKGTIFFFELPLK